MRFGSLTVLHEDKDRPWDHTHYYVVCRCDCGKIVSCRTDALTRGKHSCGCENTRRTTHGLARTRAYQAWRAMIRRCENPSDKTYNNYGGRGISVCEEWHDPIAFCSWANEHCGEDQSLSLDRIDNDGNYTPDNCRFVDAKTQGNNRRTCHNITYNGETKTIAEWQESLGLPDGIIYQRLYAGWTAEKALNTPARKRKDANNGKQQTFSDTN